MRKLILSGVLIFTLIFAFVCVKSGMAGPIRIYSYKDLKTQSEATNKKMNELDIIIKWITWNHNTWCNHII